jgi:hypothetical protein
MSNSENEWRDRVLIECAKLQRLFVASPQALLDSHSTRVGQIQREVGSYKVAGNDLVSMYGELRDLINNLREERDRAGGTVLNQDREQLLTDDPRCPNDRILMVWKSVPNVNTGWSEPKREIRLFRCPTCDVVLWDGRINSLAISRTVRA